MKSLSRVNREQVWRDHVATAGRFPGSIESYCRSQNLSATALHYWRRKISTEVRSRPVLTAAQFVRVEIERPEPQRMPDAVWVADLILHLARGGAR